MTTFSDLVHEAQERAEQDAVAAGMPDDGVGLADHGTGARAYGEAVGVYLALVIDKMTDYHSSICSWHTSRDTLSNVFGRQAIPMKWDYAEGNPFCSSSGSHRSMLGWVLDVLMRLPTPCHGGTVRQFDAQSDNGIRGVIVSTDPPYYDNIGYADLSDYFYVWLRRSLRATYPGLFGTMLVPKHEELVATPYREGRGKEGARDFFEQGMFQAFKRVYQNACDDVPVTIYYAFKQSETETQNTVEATASTGWETMLAAILRAGFSVVGTWPIRTELTTALKGKMNALATSVALVCRKRDPDAPMATRRDFVAALKRELRPALDKLRTSNIAPVDLAQSAIGPGIGVYSRFSKVLEADGSEMSVRSALQIINQELDLYFSDQDSDLDRESRFCVELYTQCAFNEIRYGEADVLARAKNTSISRLAERGALSSSKGLVRLLTREELKELPEPSFCWLFTQQLARAMEKGGVDACTQLVRDISDGRDESAKALAYRLYTIAERKGWSAEAYAYNSLVTAWPEIQSHAAQLTAEGPTQGTLNFGETDI